MNKPNPEEHAAYYSTYINQVPDGDILDLMNQQMKEIENFISKIDEEKSKYRYASDKWSIREVFGHILDGERIFAYRALRFSRDDKTEIAGFDQNNYITNSNYDSIPLANLLEQFLALRNANILLFKTFSDEMWLKSGIASKNLISVRAIAYVMVGHCTHHVNVIQTKYLC
jgi:uncharacterized damage-inducible protein DinB